MDTWSAMMLIALVTAMMMAVAGYN